jgi:hypothetical protein
LHTPEDARKTDKDPAKDPFEDIQKALDGFDMPSSEECQELFKAFKNPDDSNRRAASSKVSVVCMPMSKLLKEDYYTKHTTDSKITFHVLEAFDDKGRDLHPGSYPLFPSVIHHSKRAVA